MRMVPHRTLLTCAVALAMGLGTLPRAARADVPTVEPRRLDAARKGGIRWLLDNQIREGADAGSWACERAAYRPAVASLAGLALLANGYLPGEGEAGAAVSRTLGYVMRSADGRGYLGQGDRSGMYIHAICSLYALSCFGMQPDTELEPRLAEWCRRSLDVIVEAQAVRRNAAARGGWRYTPDTTESDVSVTSWQLMVLHAARQCGFEVDASVIEEGLAYVDRGYRPEDPEVADGPAAYLYRPGVSLEPEPAVTGVALLIRSIYGPTPMQKQVAAVRYLADHAPAWGGRQYGGYFYFSLFYMTQGMFHAGEGEWPAYRDAVYNVLVEHQSGDGRWPFPPDNAPQSRLTGDAYPTAMAVLLLSLEQQYLPMYQRQGSLY